LSYTRTCSIFRGQQTQLALLLILNRGRRIKLGASQRNGYSPLLMLFPPGGHFARPGILYCCLRWPTSAGILSMWSRRRTIGRALWSWERTRHAITSPGRSAPVAQRDRVALATRGASNATARNRRAAPEQSPRQSQERCPFRAAPAATAKRCR